MIKERLVELENYKEDSVPEGIPQGDMPSDPVTIVPAVVEKANILFPYVVKEVETLMEKNPNEKVVIGVAGGSGVGKTCVASIMAYYFNKNGIGAYTMSGDNYPRRIPEFNDAERVHIFRENGIKGLVSSGYYTEEVREKIHELQKENNDADSSFISTYPWLTYYIQGGIEGLKGYLGTSHEINFKEVDSILKAFKEGQKNIWLKRMGRTENDIDYVNKDFSNTHILILEWTHGLNFDLKEVDLPILLNSTPKETLEFRKARNRDGGADSPFVMNVLEIEQKKLHSQAVNAKLIMTKSNEIISYDEYLKQMEGI